MGFTPKDAVDAAKDIATNTVEKAADIVESAGGILRGDVSGAAEGIVQSATDIATYAVDRTREAIKGTDVDD